MNDNWQKKLDQVVDQQFDEMVVVRRQLHANPEPSGEEHETSLYLYQRLNDRGFDVQMGPEGRGVVADFQGEQACSRIAIRADLDALRIQDQKDVPYHSRRPGVMHACGHDAHTATVFGAMVALRDAQTAGIIPWPVQPRGIFQPSEETATGAREMIDAGALTGIDTILATHVDPTRLVGRVGTRRGVMTAHCDDMKMTITGRGGHAARPHESKDPIAAAAQLISTLYLFVPRATDSQDAVVITVGQVHGGDNPNVIPEQVELNGTVRTLDSAVRERIIAHIGQLARGIEEMAGVRIEVKFETSIGGVCNDPHLTQLVQQAAAGVLGKENVETIPRPSMGSEDFAVYLQHVPGVMFRLGCANGASPGPGLHTPTFDVDERALAIGAKILARTAVLYSAPTPKK